MEVGARGHAGKGSRMEVVARVRTLNMRRMVATLDVSNVSGWLKASAFCRVARWVYDVEGGREVHERVVGGGNGASGMQGRARLEVGARARTLNISSMVVTLDVSKLSGWLKASASCRVARWAYDARGTCGPGGESPVGGGDGVSGMQ